MLKAYPLCICFDSWKIAEVKSGVSHPVPEYVYQDKLPVQPRVHIPCPEFFFLRQMENEKGSTYFCG